MKKPDGYDTTQAFDGSFERLDPGGFVCRITAAKDDAYNGRGRIAIAFDICEGPLSGYYKRKHERFGGNWPGTYRQFTENKDGTCSPFFKGMITAIEESNPGFVFNWDERTLAGKYFGGVFGSEEYMTQTGEIKTIVRCSQIRSVNAIKTGDYQIPELKKFRPKETAALAADLSGFTSISSDDIPF